MSAPTNQTRARGTHRRGAARAACTLLTLLLSLVVAPASAYWTSTGTGTGTAATGTLSAPVNVTATPTAIPEVDIAWAPGVGGVTPQGYYVTRHVATSPATVDPACSSSPTVLLPGPGCTDTGVADGEYTYLVTAVFATWTAPSSPSGLVSVTTPSRLGVAADYSVLAGTAVVSTGLTTISGDVGVSPGTAVTGLEPGAVGGDIHANDADAIQAQEDMDSAYDELDALPVSPGGELTGDLAGRTLGPGVYHSTAALALTGVLILDAGDDNDAIFVFQADAAFDTAALASVVLLNGAKASNIYWVVTGATGAGAGSQLSGNILSQGAITLGLGTVLIGRALSVGAVTLAGNTIRFGTDLPPTMLITGGPTAVTQDVTPTISGTTTAPVSSPVTVTIDGQSLSTTVTPAGTWAVTAAGLAAGVYDVIAKVRAPSGDGAVATQDLTVEVNPAPVDLATAATFSVLGSTSVASTGLTHLSGDLGVSPSSTVTGFGPLEGGTLAGTIHAGDAAAATARGHLAAAFGNASARTRHTEIVGDLGGRIFHVGVHHSTAALSLTGSVILDGQGDPDAVFIFQSDAAFNTAAASTVILTGGTQAKNVFWVVTGAAGTGAGTSLAGSILANGAITLGSLTTLQGQALSLDAVTLASNTLTAVTPADTP